jgi:hypothetical protein
MPVSGRTNGCPRKPGAAHLRVVEREQARDALVGADVKRLMTIPGIDT